MLPVPWCYSRERCNPGQDWQMISIYLFSCWKWLRHRLKVMTSPTENDDVTTWRLWRHNKNLTWQTRHSDIPSLSWNVPGSQGVWDAAPVSHMWPLLHSFSSLAVPVWKHHNLALSYRKLTRGPIYFLVDWMRSSGTYLTDLTKEVQKTKLSNFTTHSHTPPILKKCTSIWYLTSQ